VNTVREIRVVDSVGGSVRVPGSKSLTLRAILAGALARGTTVLRHALRSDDVVRMARGVRGLGAHVEMLGADGSIRIEGVDGSPATGPVAIDVGDCGTCMRFLLAAACLGEGERFLDGSARMRERPIGALGLALARLGARLEYPGRDGHPPVRVAASGVRGGEIEIDASWSSQFLSALLLVGPYAASPLVVRPTVATASRPYVRLTEEVVQAFGGRVEAQGSAFRIEAGRTYRGREFEVEGDWSSASYFLAAAALCGGEVEIRGLRRGSRQGDAVFLELLERLGGRSVATEDGVRFEAGPSLPGGDLRLDLRDAPDIVPTVAVVAAFRPGRTEICGVPHLRIKESDRIATVATELRRIGARVEERPDGLGIEGGARLCGAAIDPHGDHRIAMSLALAGLRIPGVVIHDPACVAKSYPGYFDDLERIGRREGEERRGEEEG